MATNDKSATYTIRKKKNEIIFKKNHSEICINEKTVIPLQRKTEKQGRLAQLVQSICLQRKTEKQGRLAQLVQSICLTSRGSAVRIRQRPQMIKVASQ